MQIMICENINKPLSDGIFPETERMAIPGSPLSEPEYTIWRAWLGRSAVLHDCDHYPMPQQVLAKLAAWKAERLFDNFEIRISLSSGEATCFGAHRGHRWLLARWKQSEGSLASFEEIVDHVTDYVRSYSASFGSLAIVIFVLGFLGLCGGINVLLLPRPDLARGIPALIISTLASLLAFGAWNDRKDRLWRAIDVVSRRLNKKGKI